MHVSGAQRTIRFQFCDCNEEVVTLIKLGFLAATPKRPHVALQFQLLDLLEALLFECQIAVKDFVSALVCISRCPLQVLNYSVSLLYTGIYMLYMYACICLFNR